MKLTTKIYGSFLLAVLCAGAWSCQKDGKELNKGEEALVLNASESSIVLNQRLADNRALSLEWGSGSNKGTGAAIFYTFEMDLKGNDFQGGLKHETGKTDSRVINFTHSQLNDTIAKYWASLPIEVAADFEARIVARVAIPGFTPESSNVVGISLTSYKGRFLNLYMLGSATAGGWDNQRATAMSFVEGEHGAFAWRGELKAGELKFITKLGSFDNSYSKGADDNSLLFNDPDDIKFMMLREATYEIEINIEELTIDINMVEGTEKPFAAVWMIGSATAGGWSTDNGTAMTSLSGGRFEWEGNLSAGEFKFITVPGLFAPSFGKGGSDGELKLRYLDTEPDENFSVEESARYKVEIDTEALTIAITQTGEGALFNNVWIMADGLEDGWNWDKLTPLTQNQDDPNEFTFEGHLGAGSFKFPVEIDHSWGGRFVVGAEPNPELTDTRCRIVAGGDDKWNITDAGAYRIVIHLKNETISIAKQPSDTISGDFGDFGNDNF